MDNWKARPFTHLRGNAKVPVNTPVGPKTFVIGPNQSGKSGLVIDARYALAGVKGWSLGVHGSAIAELVPEGHDTFFAELDGPDGTASFQVLKEGAKWRDPQPGPTFTGALAERLTATDKKAILPLVSMRDLLEMGPDLGRRAFMLRFGNAAKVPDLIKPRPDQLALWNKTRDEQTVLLTVTDPKTREKVVPDASVILVAMNKAFARLKKAEGVKISGLEKALAARRSMLVEEAAGSEVLPVLVAQHETARLWEAAAHLRGRLAALEKDKAAYREMAAPFMPPERDIAARQEREAARAQVRGDFEVKIANATAAIEVCDKDITAQTDIFKIGKWFIKAVGQSPFCPVCRTTEVHPVGGGEAHAYSAAEIQAFIEPMVADRQKSIAAADVHRAALALALRQERTAFQQWEQGIKAEDAKTLGAKNQLTQEHARIMSAEREVQAALAATNAPASYTGQTAAELEAHIDALKAADVARQKLEEDTAELRGLRASQDLAKELETEAKTVLDVLIARAKSTGEAAVNMYMADGLRAAIDLEGCAWRVLDKSGPARTRHTASGFELDVLTPALAAGYTEGPLRVLTLDDEDLAGVGLENAERFFAALGKAVDQGWLTQVFCAGNRFEMVIPALERMGWTIIHTGNGVQSPPVGTRLVLPVELVGVPVDGDGDGDGDGAPELTAALEALLNPSPLPSQVTPVAPPSPAFTPAPPAPPAIGAQYSDFYDADGSPRL